MSLLSEVVGVLQRAGIAHALIGAAAMAVHGVSRATADVDLLTVDRSVLRPDLWQLLKATGVEVKILKGDSEDPLAGNVRLSRSGDRTVDVVVGRHEWQRDMIDAATSLQVGGLAVRVVGPAGLILLKLDAGGPKDAWDVQSLLESLEHPREIGAEVDRVIPRLAPAARRLWKRLRDAG